MNIANSVALESRPLKFLIYWEQVCIYEIFLEISLFISWYCSQFDISIHLIAILFMIVNIIVQRIILYLFPFLNRVADVLTHPFGSARFVIRVNTTYKLEKELKVEQKYDQANLSQSDTESDRIELGVYNRLEVNSQQDGSNVYFSSTCLRFPLASKYPSKEIKGPKGIMFTYIVVIPILNEIGEFQKKISHPTPNKIKKTPTLL
ncbi:MAG: hypothetical protein ACFFC6_12145 [Promethearchaeota archaeon]